MSSRRVRSSIWGKLSKLAFRKKAGSRKRQVFRTSLLEQFEKRELMAFEVSNIQLVSDTGISATDKITYDPRLQGTVANTSGGGLGGLPGGPPSLVTLHVQFDHGGDGIGDGSTIVDSSMNFQYDPRTSDPGLSFYVGPFSPKYRILEYDNFNNLMATGSWNTFSMTLETVASGEIQVQDSLNTNLPSQGNFHFGDADVGAVFSKTFTITNTASPTDPNAVLRLNTAGIQLPPGFSISQAFGATVAPGAQTTFTVSVDTSVAGPRWGTFSFATSDSDENPFVLNFTADVLSMAPEIDIRNEATGQSLLDGSGSINFGSTELATPVQRSIRISNYGRTALNLGVPAVGSGFAVVSAVPSTLPPNSSVVVTLEMTAAAIGSLNIPFSLTSTDSNESPYDLTLVGTVTAASAPYVDQFRLASNDGVSATDNISSNPTVTGYAKGAFHGQSVRIEFDHRGTGQVGGSVTVNTVGDLFTYDPRTTDSSLVGFTGRLPFRYRLIHLNSAGNVITTGNWVSYPIVIDGIATTSGLSLSGFSLVRDTGTSIVDRVTTDPRIQATLVGNRAGATVRIEFDQQGNGNVTRYVEFPSGSNSVTYDPRTGDTSLLGKVGPVELKYRLTRLDSAGTVLSTSPWITFAYELAALPTSTFEVRNLRLVNDTGTSATDKVTSDPTLTGNLLETGVPPKDVAYSLVQFDHNGDGLADGNALTDDLGVFEYRPLGLTYSTHTLRVRSAQYDVAYGSYLLGPWSEIPIHYIAPPAPQFTSLALVSDTGVSSTDKITDNPAIVGTLTLDDRPVSDYLVYIDHNGNGSADGTAITDRYGNFVYRPQNLPTGPVTLTLITAYWDSNLQSTVYSQPTTFQYTYLAAPLPSIEWLEIAIDDGENKFDRQTTSSLIAGQLSTSAVHAGVQIQFDNDGNGTVDGVAITDSFGAIMYRPFGLAPGAVEVSARVNHWNADQAQWVTGPWKDVSFVLVASNASSMNVTSLGLRRDTGISATDNTSSEGTIVGQIGFAGSGTSVSLTSLSNQRVEFDENGDDVIDGIAFTEADGKFQYTPKSLTPGAKNVRARTRVWNTATHQGELGAWQTYSYTIAADPVIPAAIQTMGLLSDSGASASDYITRNSAITGTVALASGQATALIEVDLDNNGTADFTTNTDSAGNFLVYPNFTTFGAKTVAIRTFTFDSNSTNRVYSSWQSFSYTYSDLASEPASITNLVWTPATHTSPAKLSGRVLDDTQVSGVNVEIDLNGDNISEAVVKSDAFGKFEYTYTPSTSSPPTQVTLQIRTSQSINGQTPQTSTWNSHTFSNPAPAALTPPSLGAWGLAVDDGASATDNASTDLTLKGAIQAGTSRSGVSEQLVQFDVDGDGAPDGSTLTDADGKFSYTPSGLAVGSHTLKTRLITFDPDLGMIQGAWSSISVTQTAMVVTKVATLGLVSDTGTAGDGATANVAVQGTITGPSVGNVLIFFDVDGDGSPDGNATTNSAGAFSFTPTTPDNEGFVQVDAWLARGGSPSDSNSRTFRFVYSSAPNDSGAQALVTELATFDSAWQNANTTLEQGIAAAKNALKSSLQTADATYRQEMSTAMGLYQSTRLSTVTAYRDQLRAAEFQLGTSLSAAEAAFLSQSSGQSYGTDPEFVWPITPPEDAFVIPNDADQPAPPKYYGLDAGPTLDVGTHPNALQLAAISDSNAAIVKAAALAAYNQAVNQASTTAASERATAFQLFATSVSQSRATEAAVLSQLKHPTIDIGTESQGLFTAQQAFTDVKNATMSSAMQAYTVIYQNATEANLATRWQAQATRSDQIDAAWAAYIQALSGGPLLPEQEQQIAQTRDAAIRQAHIDCEKAFADADYTWGVIVYTAAKTLAFTDAEATYNTIALAAEKAQGMRDTIAEMNYWIRDQKITAEYNKLVATAESAEKRARDEADAAHKEAQSQINAAYDLVSSEADADDQNTKEKSSIPVNLLSPFASFLDTPAAQWQLAEAQLTKTATDSKSDAKKNNTKSKAEEEKDAKIAANNEAKAHAYRVAAAQKAAALAKAQEQRDLRDAANDTRYQLDIDTSMNIYLKEMRAAAANRKHVEDVATTNFHFNMSYAQNEKTMGYANAIHWADFQMAGMSDLSAQSAYFQALAATRYDFEISMATAWETYRKGQADDVYNNTELRAQHEFFNISDTETTDHDTRVAIATFVSVYDDMMTSIITTEANSSANSSSQYNTQVLQSFLGMFQANAQHDLDYGTEVGEANRDEKVNKTTTKSEKTVATYQNHQTRVSEFATSQASPWGQLQLNLANAALTFQNLFKTTLVTYTTDSEDRSFSFLGDYLQEVKSATVSDANSGTTLVQSVLGSLMSYISGTNSTAQTNVADKIAAFKAFQIAVSLVYKNWKIRVAEIERDKKIADADALRDFLHGEALVLKNAEPALAYARKNLAIAQAKFTFNQITSAEMATAQADYASSVATVNAQIATLREPLLLAQRTAEGEAIRVKTVETAKAEKTRVTDSSAPYLTWVSAAGTADIAAATSMKTSGDTFVTSGANASSTANDTVQEANKTFISNVSADSADLSSDLTGIINAFYTGQVGANGDLTYSKVDARAGYESTLAENHRVRKETVHLAGASPLTNLQFAVATADAAKYGTRRTAFQTRTLAAKNDNLQLTTLLNTADQNLVDQLNTAELQYTNGSVQISTSSNKQAGTALATLGKDSSKASINRAKEDVSVRVTASNSVAAAEVAHMLRVQTAKVTLAEATGAALKQKHIDQYTQAAITAAESAIAQATTVFKASEKTSNITRAGDVGDAAIAAATASGQNLIAEITSQNSASATYTSTANTIDSTLTTTINSLTVPHTQGTQAAVTTADVASATALRGSLASAGTADVNWITAFANADATRTGSQASAQANWVTSSVQSGSSVLLWNCGDIVTANASGSWASQYAPARTAMITTTALVDAGRQIAAWFDRTVRDNDQADADVQYIQSIASPETQLAVSATQRENQYATSSTNTSNDLSTELDTSGANIQSTSAAVEKTAAVDSATAWKAYQVALASLDEGAATTAVEKTYQDALAQVTRNSRVAYANLTYTEGVAQIGSVGDAITDMGQTGKTYVTNLAGDEKTFTDTAAPIIGARTLLYTQADNDLHKAITTADNVWRNGTAQAWGTHTAGDLIARGNVRRTLANTSNLVADASQASIAELKAQWWQNEIPNYLQWSVDIGGIETTYTNNTTANILLRTTGVKNAGVTYASTVGTAIRDYETTTATAREQYLSTLMSIGETAAEATMRADRDKKIALADADLQKQLNGNESAHTTAVNNANSAHSTATANAEAARKSAEQAALTQLNSTLAQATKDKESAIAGAERTYDQTVASLDAQYGSESSNGDTGVEGATRRSAIKTRDAQYYAARDTSWANTLSGSTTLGTSPWSVKAISAANAQAAYSTSRASAQAAHDAAMLDAIEDWQLSSRESLTDLLFTEGQSRETFNVATSNVYANWENGVGNLLGDRPDGTGFVTEKGYGGRSGGTLGAKGSGNNLRFGKDEDETITSGDKSANVVPSRPILPASETNSKSQILFLTQQQQLDLEGKYGADFIARLREFYRVRDPNVGFYAGDLINSINDPPSDIDLKTSNLAAKTKDDSFKLTSSLESEKRTSIGVIQHSEEALEKMGIPKSTILHFKDLGYTFDPTQGDLNKLIGLSNSYTIEGFSVSHGELFIYGTHYTDNNGKSLYATNVFAIGNDGLPVHVGLQYWDDYDQMLAAHHMQQVLQLTGELIQFNAAIWMLNTSSPKVPLRSAIRIPGIPVLTSFDDLILNPLQLYGKSADEIAQILGPGWTIGKYGRTGTGWAFRNGDKLVYFHEGGKHVGPYFGVRSGLYNFKVVGPGYKPLPGDRALIIPFRIPKPTGTLK
ncbi:MAG: choice-of-anchor D domain-containing protein [Planctomycetaceae bacterium]|nr:choice-of-anchor D domain-containing protein [Planctomycetaceae bacterium]